MNLKYRKDLAFTVASFYLRVVGFWLTTSRLEECFRIGVVGYTILAITFSAWVQIRGLYFNWGDFSACTYIACDGLGLVMDFFKIFSLFIHQKKFLGLMAYMQKNFWHYDYDEEENLIVKDTKKTTVYFVCILTFSSLSSIFMYMFRPLLTNIGRNETDRILIFNMYLDLPLSISPYYEIAYTIQIAALNQAGSCYFCFDNIFCILCLNVACQFRILQYRIANAPILKKKENLDSSKYPSDECYNAFKNYIQQHQALLDFCETLEQIFTIIVVGQILMFSILFCFLGYQVILADLTTSYRVSFISYLFAGMCQLWMFTYSCDCITQESAEIASAAYTSPWIDLPMDKFGKMLRKDLQIVVMRSRRACCLTACGFFPISLETYTKIMSTTMSYFTLLKQRTVDAVDT